MLQISVEHLTAIVQLMLVPNSRQHFFLQLKRSCRDCGVEQGTFDSYKNVKSMISLRKRVSWRVEETAYLITLSRTVVFCGPGWI